MLGRTNAGGIALNFKITPYATKAILLADSPRENTIGVVTGNEITSYIFSPNEPPVPTPGMLWIAVGTSSSATFNAVKKNAIQVCPMYAKHCVGTAWVDVEAFSYINGAWVEWTRDIILYDNGKTDITLDMTNAKDSGTYLTLTLGTSSNAKARALVNLSGQEKLEVVYSNLTPAGSGGRVYAQVWDADGNEMDKETYRAGPGTSSDEKSVTLDITALNGTYMVGVFADNYSASNAGSVRIKSIKVLKGEGSSTDSGSSGQIVLETKEVTPTKDGLEVTPTPGNALSMVIVKPIPDYYQDVSAVPTEPTQVLDGCYFMDSTGALIEGEIPVRSSADIIASGATVSVPAGYYESAVSKTVDADGNDAVIQALTVTANGTYAPPSGVDGYAPVTVNVPVEEGITLPTLDNQGTANDLARGTQLIDANGGIVDGTLSVISQMQYDAANTTVQDNGTSVSVNVTRENRVILESGTTVSLRASYDKFGDARQDQVLEGVYFTSAEGFNLPGTMRVATSDTLVTKTGTTTSTTVDTGLAEIVAIMLKATTQTATGIYTASYMAYQDILQYTGASVYSGVKSMFTLTAPEPGEMVSINGGVLTWKSTGSTGFISGVSYDWYAIGYE